jgi:hypothetical protein
MANFIYDAKLSFGTAALASATSFPDILNLGKTDADRMTVDVCCNTPAGGTSIAVTAQGSSDGSTGWTTVGTMTFTLADMKNGACQTAISPNQYPYLRVTFAKMGTFTGGTAECFLNTYAGK